ncbi:DUF3093 family protein [Hydrogenophaga sp. PBL-H3]|uniref:DUF3093 family protein n=1 Tax=Hydrogenophaga sp. PBL-H3 TaxID=434010 RepID=UPI003FA5D40B
MVADAHLARAGVAHSQGVDDELFRAASGVDADCAGFLCAHGWVSSLVKLIGRMLPRMHRIA